MLFSRKSGFRILDIQISWHHQMPNYKTRNKFYCITWEVNTFHKWNLASLCHITKEENLWKNSRKIVTWQLVPRPFCLQRIKCNFYWKMKFLKQAVYIRLCISKTIKICLNQQTDLLRFLFTGHYLKIKKGLELVSRPHFS